MTKEERKAAESLLTYVSRVMDHAKNGQELNLQEKLKQIHVDIFAEDELDFMCDVQNKVPQIMKDKAIERAEAVNLWAEEQLALLN
jgi:glycerol-3-phosphate cytidylyltransferase-like family protein